MIVGRRILCSGCGRSFAAQSDAIHSASTPPPLPYSLPRRNVLWVALILGGLLILMCTTLALTFHYVTKKEPQTASVDVPEPTLAEPEKRNTDPVREIDPPPQADRVPPPPPRRDVPPPLPFSPRPAQPTPSEPAPPALEPRSTAWLASEEQEKVNKAIDRGVEWLKKEHSAHGKHGFSGYPVGFASLVGLTLLECGVPHDDPSIRLAVRIVRTGLPKLRNHVTYQLSLAILFLDRHDDPTDERVIRTCAVRLAAGQTSTGGWSYECPKLSAEDEMNLFTALQQTRPTNALDLFVAGPGGSAPPSLLAKPLETPPEKRTVARKEMEKALDRLPDDLRGLPSLRSAKISHLLPSHDEHHTDNSNTQFAILGLCAAQRHKLPLERTLALIAQRFRKSQTADGGWAYRYVVPGERHTPSMTGAGLLGLAVGHGLIADYANPQARPVRLDDPAVENGFRVLAESIGDPLRKRGTRRGREPINVYFLWTVERVGVLYDRREIDGKAWYPWGAKILLRRQNASGAWMLGGYPGTSFLTDTCFALLFLKRANLAKELTKKLEFLTEERSLHTRPAVPRP